MTQDAKITAQKIRTELKNTFKTCKFSVTIERYSMGQTINISWNDGVSSVDVENLINKIEDEYQTQKIKIRNERSSFIFTKRNITESNRAAVKYSILEELLSSPIDGLEDWEFHRMINNRVASTTFF